MYDPVQYSVLRKQLLLIGPQHNNKLLSRTLKMTLIMLLPDECPRTPLLANVHLKCLDIMYYFNNFLFSLSDIFDKYSSVIITYYC